MGGRGGSFPSVFTMQPVKTWPTSCPCLPSPPLSCLSGSAACFASHSPLLLSWALGPCFSLADFFYHPTHSTEKTLTLFTFRFRRNSCISEAPFRLFSIIPYRQPNPVDLVGVEQRLPIPPPGAVGSCLLSLSLSLHPGMRG